MSAPSPSTSNAGATPNTQKHELVSTSSAPANLQHRHSKPAELKLYDSNLVPLSYVDASVEHGIRSGLIQVCLKFLTTFLKQNFMSCSIKPKTFVEQKQVWENRTLIVRTNFLQFTCDFVLPIWLFLLLSLN